MRNTILYLLVFCMLPTTIAIAEKPYNFRASKAYRKLPTKEQDGLEQVHRDFMMLWGALDRYADSHDEDPPNTLDQLVPYYLESLPKDPFVTDVTVQQKDTDYYQLSKAGWGYRYRKGSHGNRAWCLSSVGLKDFPYLAPKGNIGLYICKGDWISGVNPALIKLESKTQQKDPNRPADAVD